MKRKEPWSIDGIEPDIREAARVAAQRQGLSLNEWLNDVIADQASHHDAPRASFEHDYDRYDEPHRRDREASNRDPLNRDFSDLNAHQRIEAVASRLHELGGRDAHRNPAPSNARDQRPDREPVERYRQDSQRRDSYREEPRRPEPRYDTQRPYEDRSASLRESAEAARRRADREPVAPPVPKYGHPPERDSREPAMLAEIASRIVDIERELKQRSDERGLRQEQAREQARHDQARYEREQRDAEILPAVARRLANIETQLQRRPDDSGDAHLRSALARLEDRLTNLTPRAPDETRLQRLESKLDSLLNSSALSPSAPAGMTGAWQTSLDSAVAEIGGKQRVLDQETGFRKAPFRRAEASRALFGRDAHAGRDQFAQGMRPHDIDLTAIQHEIAALSRKLEDVNLPNLARDLNRVHTDIDHMSAGLADLAPRDSVNAIEAAIRNLTTRLESSREEGMREALLQPLTELADDLRHKVSALDPHPAFDGLEREIRTIGDRLNAFDPEPAALARLQKQMEEIHGLLTERPAQPMSQPTPLGGLEQRITSLAEQLKQRASQPAVDTHASEAVRAQAEALSKIDDRLDRLSRTFEQAFTARANPGVDPASLEQVVETLAEKFAAAQHSQADSAALDALQAQISDMAKRLEHSDVGFAAIASLQRSVEELFKNLDETRDHARDAAQSSADQVARDAVHALIHQKNADDASLSRELSDLRLVQDEADRRTHSTLNAVHTTLEKIVDRLAMLEADRNAGRNDPPSFLAKPEAKPAQARPDDRRAAAPDARPQQTKESRVADLASDFLIEPRTSPRDNTKAQERRRPIAQPQVEADKEASRERIPDTERSRSDFIAAARRAAQAAQADMPVEAIKPKLSAEDLKARIAPASLIAQTKDFLIQRKRQVTLSIAALFLAVGAYAVVKTMEHTNTDVSSAKQQQLTSTKTIADQRATAEKPAARIDAARPAEPALAPAPEAAPATGNAAVQPQPSLSSPATASPAAAPQASVPQATLPMPPSLAMPGADPIVTSSITGPKATAEAPVNLNALRDHANAGEAAAQYELATRYAEGKLIARDFKIAAEWYEKAAAQNLAPAEYRLGSLYEKGLGVTRNLTRAKELYEKAAARGHARAMHNLAVLTAEGVDGKPDYVGASMWFRKAADFGIRDSQYNLGILYARGLGISQDLVQSYIWFAVAAAQGDEDAGKKRDDVAARLDAKSLIRAKTSAETFHAQPINHATNDVAAPPGGWQPIPPAVSAKKAKVSRL